MEKALVLYSGGLDSRLVIKILEEKGYKIEALHFILPFGCSGNNLLEGLNSKKIKLTTLNIKTEPLLSEYLKIIKNPKYGTGSGINPCKDCKIFMLKKAYEYANSNNIKIIATGEVIGQRPMSQTSSALKTIDDEIGFTVLRPLVDLKISGRSRKKQIQLAKKYKIEYPSSGGGCLLCEKYPSIRIKKLLEKNLITEKTLPLTKIGRHFFINNTWLIVARDAQESQIITTFKTHIPDEIGKPAIYYQFLTTQSSLLTIAKDLQSVYSTGDNKEKRNKFDKYKL